MCGRSTWPSPDEQPTCVSGIGAHSRILERLAIDARPTPLRAKVVARGSHAGCGVGRGTRARRRRRIALGLRAGTREPVATARSIMHGRHVTRAGFLGTVRTGEGLPAGYDTRTQVIPNSAAGGRGLCLRAFRGAECG